MNSESDCNCASHNRACEGVDGACDAEGVDTLDSTVKLNVVIVTGDRTVFTNVIVIVTKSLVNVMDCVILVTMVTIVNMSVEMEHGGLGTNQDVLSTVIVLSRVIK